MDYNIGTVALITLAFIGVVVVVVYFLNWFEDNR